MSFTPDYPGAVVVPAHVSNYRQIANTPRGWVLHTPEERADDVEVTPYYFQQAGLQASTHYYLDNDGDVYQMVPEVYSPIANGVLGKPYPAWANPAISLNGQTVSVEIEGYAHNIETTLSDRQFDGLVRLIKHRAAAHNIPLDRAHIIGHYEVASNRSDPGPHFPWGKLLKALQQEEDEMKPFLAWCPDYGGGSVWLVGPFGACWITKATDVATLEGLYGPIAVALSAAALNAIQGA